MNRLVAEQVRPTDWVYSEYEAYYPAKRQAAVLFLPPYAGLTPEMEGAEPPLSTAERDAVEVLILKPPTEARTLRFFGGRWSLVGHYAAAPENRSGTAASLGRGAQPYELLIYRRQRGGLAAAH